MTDANTLTPCPFCGERAETYFIPERHSYQIECSDVFGCTARVTRDSEQAAIEAWNLRAPAPASQPVGMEPVYQIGQPFPFDPENTWRDASKDAYDVWMPNRRRIIYTAAQVQAMLAAAPRNAPLYDPDDVAFPTQRCADGVDALPPELASTARPTSIAAVEVAAPSGAAREPLADEQIEKLCAEIGFTNWPEWDGGTFQEMWMQLARAIEAAHGITAAQKGGKHGTE